MTLRSLILAASALAAPLAAQTPKFVPPSTNPGETPRKVCRRTAASPVGDNQNSRTAGPDGPVLLDNFHLLQKLARFDRERIPERVVHARGVAAHGEFESYEDLSGLTRAKVFSAKGQEDARAGAVLDGHPRRGLARTVARPARLRRQVLY